MNSSQPNEDKDFFPVDLIEISKNLAKEKGIDSEEILLAMETAIAKAGRTKYGQEFDIRAQVDRQSGKNRVIPVYGNCRFSRRTARRRKNQQN